MTNETDLVKQLEYLSEIREYIENGSMSFLIGAGFSKNISKTFLSWEELLTPMICEMYPHCNYKDVGKRKLAVRQIINQKGYLEIASEYVRRKGYHEAIDVYIEKNTPHLEKDANGDYVVMLNGQCIDSNPNFECHKRLMSFGIKNIYTFNYDNCLDVFGETDQSLRIDELQKQVAEQAKRLSSFKESYTKRFSSLNILTEFNPHSSDIKMTNEAIDNLNIAKLNEFIDQNKQYHLKDFSKDCSDFHEANRINLQILQDEEHRLDNEREDLQDEKKSYYMLVEQSFQISLSERRKNIYKIHGSLLRKDDQPFGFDGDTHKQFVICKEDYDEYPQKHEAFFSLMKISLLKEFFCLVGLSGDDPNLLVWINWVKDVLDKNPQREVQRDNDRANKAYFINVSASPISEDKQLLMRTHYISPVNLFVAFPNCHTDSERMLEFIKYIDPLQKDSRHYEAWWSGLRFDRSVVLNDSQIASIDQLYDYADYHRIPIQNGFSQYVRNNVLGDAVQILMKNDYSLASLKLLYLAFKGELLPLDVRFENKQKDKLLSKIADDRLKRQYTLLCQRQSVLNNVPFETGPIENDDSIYQSIVRLLFNLSFKNALDEINKWNPSDGFHSMRKMALLSIISNPIHDSESINKLLSNKNFNYSQDYMFALEVIPRLFGIHFFCSYENDKINQLKDNLKREDPGLADIWEIIDSLAVSKPKQKQPYGNANKTYILNSVSSEMLNSIKIIQIFIELAIPTKTHSILLFDMDKWINVCANIFERYPYPCMFYTLLYGNEKEIVSRIAQGYIYSFVLRPIIPVLLDKMLAALLDDKCPSNVRDGIYIAAPFFMKAVSPSRWQTKFEVIYNKYAFDDNKPDRDRINPDYHFLLEGVRLSTDDAFKIKVINDCLSKKDDIDNFYNELIIAASELHKISDDKTKSLLSELLAIADELPHFYVLFNMDFVLDKQQLIDKLCSLPPAKYNDITLLLGASSIAKDDGKLIKLLRTAAIANPYLWRTGISMDFNNVGWCGCALDVNEIQRNIGFTEEQVKIIYEKMQTALFQIEIQSSYEPKLSFLGNLTNWCFILEKMKLFLDINRDILKRDPNFSAIYKMVRDEYNHNRGGNSISELLIQESTVNEGIRSLYLDVKQHGVLKFQDEYSLLANIIALKCSKSLNDCFIHFEWALKTYKDQFDAHILKPILKSILDAYRPYYRLREQSSWNIESAEKDIVEGCLISLYSVYHSWGGKDSFWAQYKPFYWQNNGDLR